jgi:D-alanyl-D-alanine endopeptidase (penicillin-binding protein 7)
LLKAVGFHNVSSVRTLFCRWSLIATLGLVVAGPSGLTSVAHATATANNATGNKKKAGAHKAAHATAHAHARQTQGHAHALAPAHKTKGRPAPKKVFLERHVASIKGGLPNIQALGALVIDDTGHELYSRNPDKERPIASISKLAATLVVMDKGLELEGLSTIAKGDLDVARGGAKSRLLEGMTLSNRDLLHAALMGSDNRAIPALGRAVKMTGSQLAAAMTAKAKALGLKNTRFHDPTGLSTENVSTPRETIAMLKAVMNHPVLGAITHRLEYDAHPVGKPPITYNNTYKPAVRTNIQVLGGKTGYNDDARYCLVIATKIDGHVYFMSFLSNEGKLTRFGDVARVADWVVMRRPQKAGSATTTLVSAPMGKSSSAVTTVLPIGIVAPPPPSEPALPPEPAAEAVAASAGGSAVPAPLPPPSPSPVAAPAPPSAPSSAPSPSGASAEAPQAAATTEPGAH